MAKVDSSDPSFVKRDFDNARTIAFPKRQCLMPQFQNSTKYKNSDNDATTKSFV